MNYAVVAIGGVILIVFGIWFLWGKYHFSGPVRTLEQETFEEEAKE